MAVGSSRMMMWDKTAVDSPTPKTTANADEKPKKERRRHDGAVNDALALRLRNPQNLGCGQGR